MFKYYTYTISTEIKECEKEIRISTVIKTKDRTIYIEDVIGKKNQSCCEDEE